MDDQTDTSPYSHRGPVLTTVRRLWRSLPLPVRVRLMRAARPVIGRIAPGFFRVSIEMERDYSRWIACHDTLGPADEQAIAADIARLADPPTISVLMPVYNPRPDHLRAAIASVTAQLYPHWELCIADDASTDLAVIGILEEAAAAESRIKLIRRAVNGHISAASNSALSLAAGSFVALMDHDDTIPRHALYEIAAELTDHPDTDILFTDEDHIDDNGRRSSPFFKPGWNPELFLGQNLISHFGVYRRAPVEAVGGFRAGLEGSQDYDLALRVIAHCGQDRVRHVPSVLYHWRRENGAGSFSEQSAQQCIRAARLAIGNYLAATGQAGRPEDAPMMPNWTRIVRPVPDPPPLVSVVVPTRDRADLLRVCLDGLLGRTAYRNLEVLIVDNDSRETATFALFEDVRRDPRVRILTHPGPFNYSAMNNRAVALASGSLILLLNNDIEVAGPDWLAEMVSNAVRPGIGAVGAKLLYRNGLVQHGGVLVGIGGVAIHQFLNIRDGEPGYFGHLGLSRNVMAVTAACLLVRKEIYQAVGGLNEDFLPVSYNDVDFCLKIAATGLRNLWTPHAVLYHLESASRGDELTGRDRVRADREAAWMIERWGPVLKNNPDANPNLIDRHPHYRLAFPPRRTRRWFARAVEASGPAVSAPAPESV